MSDFQPGEIVNITIKGARVVDVTRLHECELGVTFDCDSGLYPLTIPLGPPGIDVARVAPAEWPPRPGDLWRNHRGVTWFGVATAMGVRLVDGRNVSSLPEYALAARGPLTLVHREDEQDGGDRG